MNTLPIAITAANPIMVLDNLVKTIRYNSGSAGGADTTIRVRAVSGGLYDAELQPGDLMVLPDVVRGVIITSPSGVTGLTGKITLGAGTLQSNRVVGSVEVVDGEKARTLAGGMYAAAPYVVTPVAAQYPVLQIWNPAASGKNIIATAMGATAGAVAQQCRVVKGAAALGTDVTATRCMNKKTGSAAPTVAQVRWATGAALPASDVGYGYGIQSNSGLAWPIKGAIAVTPGTSVELWGETANSSILGNFEFFEEAQ